MGLAARLLTGGLVGVGLAACAIGASIIVLGPDATSGAFRNAMAMAGWRTPPVSSLQSPDMDSELRFYAALWVGYGGVAIAAALRPKEWRWVTPLLCGVMALGGVGRALAWLADGAPHPLFVTLMVIEFVAPLLLMGLWLASAPRKDLVERVLSKW